MEPLTKRQRQVLSFVERSIEERGYPPTMREIGQHMGIRSTNGVNDHLKALERKGYIVREDLKSRTLRPVGSSPRTRDVPLVGRVAAGLPLLAVENLEDSLKVDRSLVGEADGIFALRVAGDSMVEDGILDGDLVFVRQQETARSGEIVVALVDEDATVKRYYPEPEGVRLQPANCVMEPIWVRPDSGLDLRILGVVVGVYRQI
ncbi:MAG: transcriptional repressor LexA [Polyangia bacterium]|mgnify:CR=1 FL=1|jgi:repressor LexA|nr:transcriptional repressor LexA [Polyangia bacterium]